MKKTSLYLEPDLDEALARRAAEDGLSKAEFIRRTLAGALSRPKRVKPEAVGVIEGGRSDVGRDVDAYLEATGFGAWR